MEGGAFVFVLYVRSGALFDQELDGWELVLGDCEHQGRHRITVVFVEDEGIVIKKQLGNIVSSIEDRTDERRVTTVVDKRISIVLQKTLACVQLSTCGGHEKGCLVKVVDNVDLRSVFDEEIDRMDAVIMPFSLARQNGRHQGGVTKRVSGTQVSTTAHQFADDVLVVAFESQMQR